MSEHGGHGGGEKVEDVAAADNDSFIGLLLIILLGATIIGPIRDKTQETSTELNNVDEHGGGHH